MLAKIKQVTGILLIMLLITLLLTGIMYIWDFIGRETAWEILTKIFYTFGAVYAFSLVILLITDKKTEDK